MVLQSISSTYRCQCSIRSDSRSCRLVTRVRGGVSRRSSLSTTGGSGTRLPPPFLDLTTTVGRQVLLLSRPLDILLDSDPDRRVPVRRTSGISPGGPSRRGRWVGETTCVPGIYIQRLQVKPFLSGFVSRNSLFFFSVFSVPHRSIVSLLLDPEVSLCRTETFNRGGTQ